MRIVVVTRFLDSGKREVRFKQAETHGMLCRSYDII